MIAHQSSQDVIDQAASHIRRLFANEGSGHDWWHIYRVWKMAIRLAETEGADLYVVQLAALLHDIADWKFHDGDLTAGPRAAREWMTSQAVSTDVIEHVCQIIAQLSYK